ncbi:hypothetical protein P8H29_10670, partial [Pandoraea communis]|nr:hypothetical protein [Pandoraea communis]
MPDLKTVTFDATNHRALIERAIEIIQDGADSLRECSCCDGDWGDEEDAKQAYDIESAVAGELRAMLAAAPTPAAQSAGQEAIYQYQVPTISGWHDCDAEAFARISELEYVETRIVYAAPVNASEPVGVAGTMPGTEGFTMACFEAAKVPVGTSLYAAPVNAPLPDWFGTSYAPPEAAPVNGDERAIDLAIAFEQQRALSIVRAVRAQHFGSLNPDIPTQASAAFDLACEEIEHRLRTEQWQLDGIAAPLPAADAQQVNGDLHGEIMNIRCTEPEEYVDAAVRMAYRVGHRDARHAAAE